MRKTSKTNCREGRSEHGGMQLQCSNCTNNGLTTEANNDDTHGESQAKTGEGSTANNQRLEATGRCPKKARFQSGNEATDNDEGSETKDDENGADATHDVEANTRGSSLHHSNRSSGHSAPHGTHDDDQKWSAGATQHEEPDTDPLVGANDESHCGIERSNQSANDPPNLGTN
jgi:hypothetical protein